MGLWVEVLILSLGSLNVALVGFMGRNFDFGTGSVGGPIER